MGVGWGPDSSEGSAGARGDEGERGRRVAGALREGPGPPRQQRFTVGPSFGLLGVVPSRSCARTLMYECASVRGAGVGGGREGMHAAVRYLAVGPPASLWAMGRHGCFGCHAAGLPHAPMPCLSLACRHVWLGRRTLRGWVGVRGACMAVSACRAPPPAAAARPPPQAACSPIAWPFGLQKGSQGGPHGPGPDRLAAMQDFDKLEMILTAYQYEVAQPGMALQVGGHE